MANKMEVPPELAQKCIETQPLFAPGNISEPLTVFEEVLLGQGCRKYGLTEKHWCQLMRTCKRLYTFLASQTFWLEYLGFSLARCPPNFSPYRLFLTLRAASSQSNWERQLLTSAVVEERNTKQLTPLVVSLDSVQSDRFWFEYLSQMLSMATYPTGPQAQTLRGVVDILLQRGKKPSEFVAQAVAISAKRNQVLTCVLTHKLATLDKAHGKATSDELVSLIPDLTSVLYLVALVNGLSVDHLKEETWKLSKKNLPGAARKAVAFSLCKLSWLGLADCFKRIGLCKAVFKSIHLQAIMNSEKVKKRAAKDPEFQKGALRVHLLLNVLRGSKYPKEKEKWDHWVQHVVVPLNELCDTNPLFSVKNKAWLSKEFNASMGGKRLPKPCKRTVEGVLAQDGNTVESWNKIFGAGVVTGAQVIANMRNLMLINYPIEKVEQVLTTKGKSLTLLQLFKVRQLVRSFFSTHFLKFIETNLKETKLPEDSNEVKLTLLPCTFKDKKGFTVEKTLRRNVGKAFSETTKKTYEELLESQINSRIAGFSKNFKPERTHSIITLTSEMTNFLRSGMPPSIPDYSRTSIWRNEQICVQDLIRPNETFDKLLVGITWCQAQNGARVDLDLSILLYDETWKFVNHCSFTQLRIPGAKHSGDFTSAPYPNGARESVELDIQELLKAQPKLKYIVLAVYTYSGQDMSSLHDASAFVANPQQSGTGPGGMNIISAARLTGKGTLNIAGVLMFDQSNPAQLRQHFICIDQTINVKSSTATASSNIVRAMVRRITDAILSPQPPRVRLCFLAALYGAMISDKVTMIHNDGVLTVSYDEQPEPRNRWKFFQFLGQKFKSLKPATQPKPGTVVIDPNSADRVYVFGGELLHVENVAHELEAFAKKENFGLVIVNMRSDLKKTDEVNIPNLGKIKSISGYDIADIL